MCKDSDFGKNRKRKTLSEIFKKGFAFVRLKPIANCLKPIISNSKYNTPFF